MPESMPEKLSSSKNSSVYPYWKLSSFYWFYFATLGAIVPYLGLYLKDLGFSASQIGELIAIILATKIISPNMLGWLADRSGRRIHLIRLGALLSCLSFAGIFINNHYWWLFVVMFSFSFFWNAILPQFEAITMSFLGDDHHRYSLIRLWGSIGFIVSVLLLGFLFSFIEIMYLPWIIILLFIGIFISSLFVHEQVEIIHERPHEPLKKLLRRPEVISLFMACLLVQMSHGPYYSFFSIYASEYHYSNTYIGFLWALGVLSEVMVFIFIPKWINIIGLRHLLLFSLLSGSLRWLVIAYFIDIPWLLTLNQLLHASTFGVYHVVVITLVHRYFTGRNQGMGQALYSSLSFGVGGALGSLYAGYLWESSGAVVTYEIAAFISFLAFLLALKYSRQYNKI
jgi:MFS transporter, PPP family, 3-phenylpropionic acid transporter